MHLYLVYQTLNSLFSGVSDHDHYFLWSLDGWEMSGGFFPKKITQNEKWY